MLTETGNAKPKARKPRTKPTQSKTGNTLRRPDNGEWANGVVLYEGPSLIDGKTPIVVIATGLEEDSENGKTGAMIQTWIICRDVNPFAALVSRDDAAICGGCRHRPKEIVGGKAKRRTCYVDLRAVLTVWKSFHGLLKGQTPGVSIYPRVATSQLADVFAGRSFRLGSYGDPAAVPLAVWQVAVSKTSSHCGYTHQWKSERLRDVTALCQASVDSVEEAAKARSLGLGYFRVKGPDEPKVAGEMTCPASKEAGKVTTCQECKRCDGRSANAIVIDAHGIGADNFVPQPGRRLAVLS